MAFHAQVGRSAFTKTEHRTAGEFNRRYCVGGREVGSVMAGGALETLRHRLTDGHTGNVITRAGSFMDPERQTCGGVTLGAGRGYLTISIPITESHLSGGKVTCIDAMQGFGEVDRGAELGV